jgi:hypothetical protein
VIIFFKKRTKKNNLLKIINKGHNDSSPRKTPAAIIFPHHQYPWHTFCFTIGEAGTSGNSDNFLPKELNNDYGTTSCKTAGFFAAKTLCPKNVF